MEKIKHELETMPSWLILLVLFLIIWEMVWKLIALWRAGRNNELGWFIGIAVFNTLGILPIVYILMRRKNDL